MTELAVALVLVVWWLAHSYLYPWKSCGWCNGDPKHRHRGAFNVWCPLCGGSGRRRRWGARILGRGFGQL